MLRKSGLHWGLVFASLQAAACWAGTDAIQAALKQAMPGITPDAIETSPMAGLYEVTVGPRLFYVSEDGRFLIQGALIDIGKREDLTEPKVAGARLQSLTRVGSNKMVIFKPKATKHAVFVFTDIDCGYCRKLHSEIDQYLKEGIEVRYLFFPRAGEDSPSFAKAVSVWCAPNRNEALTKAKKGEAIKSKECDNPVKEHVALGTAMGATGTPLIVTDKGDMLPGYVPPAQLAKILNYEGDKP